MSRDEERGVAGDGPVRWRGYPVAQHLGEYVAECLGHQLEIQRFIDRRTGNVSWDAYVDDDGIGSGYVGQGEARAACVARARGLGRNGGTP